MTPPTTLRTLEELVDAMQSTMRLTAPDATAITPVLQYLDQEGARASEDLRKFFDVDLSDEETARVVAATILYVVNRGRELSGVTFPRTIAEALGAFGGMSNSMHGACVQIKSIHGEGAGA